MSQSVTGSDYCTCELVAATSAGATTLLVTEPTEAFPTFDADNTYFYMTLVDEASYAIDANPPVQREIVKVTAYSTVSTGYSLTVVRGVGGTTGQIWASGSIAEIRPCAQWFQDLKGGSILVTDGTTTVNPTDQIFFYGAEVTNLGGGSAAVSINETLLSHSVTMSSADLLAWYGGADFEFVPAPDSDHYILPVQTIYQFNPVATPYNTNSGNVQGYYGNSGSGLQMTQTTPLAILEQTESAFITTDDLNFNKSFMFLYSQTAGMPLVGAFDEPISDGDGTMTITTYYFLRSIQAP